MDNDAPAHPHARAYMHTHTCCQVDNEVVTFTNESFSFEGIGRQAQMAGRGEG